MINQQKKSYYPLQFIIIQTVHPLIDKVNASKNIPPSFQKMYGLSKKIHMNMVQRKWIAWGSDPTDSIQEQFKRHLVIRSMRDNFIQKQKILKNLKQIFQSNNYQHLAVFLNFHSQTKYQPNHQIYYYFMQIISLNGKKNMQIRQVLNIWNPLKLKHLYLSLCGCGENKEQMLGNLLSEYKLSSSITVLSTIDKYGTFLLYSKGECYFLDIIFRKQNLDQKLKQISTLYGQDFICSNTSHQEMLELLAQGFKYYSQKQTQLLTSQTQLNQQKNHTLEYFDQQSQSKTSQYFGFLKKYQEGWKKQGRGFTEGKKTFFQGQFSRGKFQIGKLHLKQDCYFNKYHKKKYCKYGNLFSDYFFNNLGCITYQGESQSDLCWLLTNQDSYELEFSTSLGQMEIQPQITDKNSLQHSSVRISSIANTQNQDKFWKLQIFNKRDCIRLYYDYINKGILKKFEVLHGSKKIMEHKYRKCFYDKQQFEKIKAQCISKISKGFECFFNTFQVDYKKPVAGFRTDQQLKIYQTKQKCLPTSTQMSQASLSSSKNAQKYVSDYAEFFKNHNLFNLFDHYVVRQQKPSNTLNIVKWQNVNIVDSFNLTFQHLITKDQKYNIQDFFFIELNGKCL